MSMIYARIFPYGFNIPLHFIESEYKEKTQGKFTEGLVLVLVFVWLSSSVRFIVPNDNNENMNAQPVMNKFKM